MKSFINNVPEYAYNHAYIVARRNNGAWWFWGAYDDRNRANEVAIEEDGSVFSHDVVFEEE